LFYSAQCSRTCNDGKKEEGLAFGVSTPETWQWSPKVNFPRRLRELTFAHRTKVRCENVLYLPTLVVGFGVVEFGVFFQPPAVHYIEVQFHVNYIDILVHLFTCGGWWLELAFGVLGLVFGVWGLGFEV
jgi:hypothetical protein